MAEQAFRVAFDIGGTFTDIIALDGEMRVATAKVLSLLDNVGQDVVDTVGRLPSATGVDYFAHATTICSNALIERQGALTGLITTRGFRDVLELRAQRGPGSPNSEWRPPAPLVERELCLEVAERMGPNGEVVAPLDEAEARARVRQLVDAGVESIAVCLLNAYANGAHERRIAEIAREEAPHLVVSVSSEIHPEIRENERFSTTAINATLAPVVGRYLDRLQDDLSVLSRRVVIMQSNGGVMSAEAARRRPMLMVESGPAAGVLAAARLAQSLGLPRVISFDMGGTTAKACLIENGEPLERATAEVGGGATAAGDGQELGHVLRAPTIDIVEVGAGGGSIAWAFEGTLRVGPRSAGASPGPACYGKGGTAPTVTDANVVLGYINPDRIADGALALDRTKAIAAFAPLADELGLELMPAAYGVTQVANAVMMRAIRAVSIERGHDARDFVMVAFGGGGPLHAVALAESMNIRQVVVPPYSGVFSALGLLLADYRLDLIRSVIAPLEGASWERIRALRDEMRAQALAEMAEQRMPLENVRFELRADLRYDYQLEELTLELDDADLAEGFQDGLTKRFSEAHAREFGAAGSGRLVLVNLRLRTISPGSRASLADLKRSTAAPAEETRRDAWFGPEHGMLSTPVCQRGMIRTRRPGPLIVEEPDTTVVVRPGWSVELDSELNLLITRD